MYDSKVLQTLFEVYVFAFLYKKIKRALMIVYLIKFLIHSIEV